MLLRGLIGNWRQCPASLKLWSKAIFYYKHQPAHKKYLKCLPVVRTSSEIAQSVKYVVKKCERVSY